MKQLLVLSGKGGTGKTTTSGAFIAFSKAEAFADCDVDAPNLHLIAKMEAAPTHSDFYGGQKAHIQSEQCIGCGQCQMHCRFDAVKETDGHFAVNDMACEGCGVCELVCPAGAVALIDDIAGELQLYNGRKVFSTAKLKMGRGNSGKLVTEVKKALTAHSDAAFAIIDGSPGIGCPVIASISGVHMVLIVAEPSLSGMSDMQRILNTCASFGTKVAVCVNKFDACPEKTEAIEQYCQKENIPFVGKIPFDPHVSEAINKGCSVADIDCPARDALFNVYEQVKRFMA